MPKISQVPCNKKKLEVSLKNTSVEDKTEKMSSKNGLEKSREDVLAAREAKKLAKQKAKLKNNVNKDNVPKMENVQSSVANNADNKKEVPATSNNSSTNTPKTPAKKENLEITSTEKVEPLKSKDEVDKAVIRTENVDLDTNKTKELIKAERAAKKAAKQAKKKPAGDSEVKPTVVAQTDLTVKDVVNTLKDIVNVAKEVQAVTDKVIAIDFSTKKVSFVLALFEYSLYIYINLTLSVYFFFHWICLNSVLKYTE